MHCFDTESAHRLSTRAKTIQSERLTTCVCMCHNIPAIPIQLAGNIVIFSHPPSNRGAWSSVDDQQSVYIVLIPKN